MNITPKAIGKRQNLVRHTDAATRLKVYNKNPDNLNDNTPKSNNACQWWEVGEFAPQVLLGNGPHLGPGPPPQSPPEQRRSLRTP